MFVWIVVHNRWHYRSTSRTEYIWLAVLVAMYRSRMGSLAGLFILLVKGSIVPRGSSRGRWFFTSILLSLNAFHVWRVQHNNGMKREWRSNKLHSLCHMVWEGRRIKVGPVRRAFVSSWQVNKELVFLHPKWKAVSSESDCCGVVTCLASDFCDLQWFVQGLCQKAVKEDFDEF